jgi:hypothetical protein
MQERYRDDLSTHPELDLELWLEAVSVDGPNKNWIYGISNITAENLQTT